MNGMTGMAIRSLYLSFVRPIFDYGFEVWKGGLCHKYWKIHVMRVMKNTRCGKDDSN